MSAFGQENAPLTKGRFQLDAGAAFDEVAVGGYLGLDYAVHDDISIGLNGTFRSYDESGIFLDYVGDYYTFQFNGNYHFNSWWNMSNKWDVYAGLSLGNYTISGEDSSYSEVLFDVQAGARYYFNEHLGINLEGNALANWATAFLGLSYRF